MREAVYAFSFGNLRIQWEAETVTGISKTNNAPTGYTAFSDLVYRELSEYFTGTRKQFSFPVSPHGTAFQKNVWYQLSRIPYGETRTYGEIAEAIGNPKASRAVGAACRSNPILFVIPCHRLIGANSTLTGYAAGLELKKALLRLEAKHK